MIQYTMSVSMYHHVFAIMAYMVCSIRINVKYMKHLVKRPIYSAIHGIAYTSKVATEQEIVH